ncbi:MAG: hypothetical protein LBD97_00700 [Bifidobacteriaceae bacterium]|jgi:hypothetical protein|nr:hypothetical protein [Bifidobacteriaceae bacterium]
MNKHSAARLVAAAAGAALLTGVAGAALADIEVGNDNVEVRVEIDQLPGALTMGVAAADVELVESGSTALIRQFVGALPTVTVTDTRNPLTIPVGAGWSVVGSVSDFTGDAGQPDIPAGNLGWEPNLIDGGQSGVVTQGDRVETLLDLGSPGVDPADAVGLVGTELLTASLDSADSNPDGVFTANAALFLKTSAGVAPGAYTADLTLSLFE